MPAPITPGLLILHGNRLEDLRRLVSDWTGQHPLAPLEEAVFLVQSNGIAEWLKIALAEDAGICAATRVELPARFLWRVYRQMLGRAAAPAASPFDKAPLTWRLLRLLPALPADACFDPLRRFLTGDDPLRGYQLASRLADLYDQYQVYRADWLEDWAEGRDTLRDGHGESSPLPADQRWQAELWRLIVADIPQAERQSSRAAIHRRFVAALEAGDEPVAALPRRVVLFGASALPLQTLEALAALAKRCQVILAVPNPCRFHWGDIIDGRELLRAAHRRHGLRDGVDLATIALEDLHAHSHPLLAGWGRQGRDFIRLLDEFDDAATARDRFDIARIDVFDEEPGQTLLEQVQARIRDLEPLDPNTRPAIPAEDQSIVFRVAHSALREVEILHDHLLDRLANGQIAPRDVIVMVPDIETFAPAIQAVFGRFSPNDPRHIPFAIADQKGRGIHPLLVALEWLLDLPNRRATASELRDLLDVPALAARFGLASDDLPRLTQWIEGAGIRWGLSQSHRAELGLTACGEQNSWLFGLERMLLGYANGCDGPFAGIEPFAEVGGLDAALAGALAALVARLQAWRDTLSVPVTPNEWGERFTRLVEDFFTAGDERDRQTLVALAESLQGWLADCAEAGFASPTPLAIAREAWLGALDEPSLRQRFLGGGITFCTLMPMRAIPFPQVCLLGMNDGDYPRRSSRADFDLLALPGQARPGDRSRRDDDRYLMLEALLSARRQFYLSWTGSNARDNSEEPPSVLVSQLRDYLAAGWADGVLDTRTIEHPLQPFSRRYFENSGLSTWAGEWFAAHSAAVFNSITGLPPFAPEPGFRLTLALLADFLKTPVRHFFRHRLNVVFADQAEIAADDEPFSLDALEEYQLVSDFLAAAKSADSADLGQQLEVHAERIARSGRLPLGVAGEREKTRLTRLVEPVWRQWQITQENWPEDGGKAALHFEHEGICFDDWLDGLHGNGAEKAWLRLDPAVLCIKDKKDKNPPQPRGDKLIAAWVNQLAAAACGINIHGVIVGRDAVLELGQPEPDSARQAFSELIAAWRQGMNEPLPLACQTALAFLNDETRADQAYEGGFNRTGEAERDACLARVYPDYEALTADGRFADLARRVYGPLNDWLTGIEPQIHDADATETEDGDERNA